MIYDHVGDIKVSSKRDLALVFCRNQNKVINILTETHIIHDQIHLIRKNWLSSIFFCRGDFLPCFIWDFKVSLRSTLIQKGGLSSLRLLPLMAEFFVFMSLQVIVGTVSLKACKIIWKIKMKGMKTK